MPWSNQSGGGGPWKPNNPGPWGQRPGGGGGNNGGGGGQTPPDLEELLRRSQERIKQALPGGFTSGFGILIALVIAAVLWLLSGFYTVQPNEVGLNMVFGKYSSKTSAGLRYNWPFPVGRVVKLPVTNRNSIDVGFRSRTGNSQVNVPEESLMLTG
ncbi:MAG: protease modulator HflK N-terminal domain-containing protein, partial [Beijerinckiaceae bacterium]|nr:protease modulator HflK N-terminal domain-containing protein [Beijerinckiaceae bacterium]